MRGLWWRLAGVTHGWVELPTLPVWTQLAYRNSEHLRNVGLIGARTLSLLSFSAFISVDVSDSNWAFCLLLLCVFPLLLLFLVLYISYLEFFLLVICCFSHVEKVVCFFFLIYIVIKTQEPVGSTRNLDVKKKIITRNIKLLWWHEMVKCQDIVFPSFLLPPYSVAALSNLKELALSSFKVAATAFENPLVF